MWEKVQKLADRIESRWSLYLLFIGSGVISSYVTKITDWVQAWGPIAILFAFFTGSLASAIVYYISVAGYSRWTRAKAINNSISVGGVNPLEHKFESKKIFIPFLYNPDYYPHRRKSFTNCYIHGPADVFIDGGYFADCVFSHCQIVIVEDNSSLTGVTVLSGCHFSKSVFYNITLMLTEKVYLGLDPAFRSEIRVINKRNLPDGLPPVH